MRLSVDNPFTGAVACEMELASEAQVGALLDRAREAARDVAAAPFEQRVSWLRAAVAAMQAEAEAIALDVSRTMGKPRAQALGELRTMAERAEVLCALAPEALAPRSYGPDDGIARRVERRPLGVVLDLPAWNYPLATAINVVAPALLAGNAVVIKHSPRSPSCGAHFERAFAVSGAPEGAVQALMLDYAATERMAADPRVDQVVFTGSVRGGRAVRRALADRFLQATYELGGNDGAYVAPDADLGRAVECLVDGAIYNAGQSCCAVERIYVHERLHDDFVQAIEPLVRGYVLGDPLDDATTLGPIAQPGHASELEGLVRDAERGGARRVVGGRPAEVAGRGRFFQATLLTGMQADMRLMREESFGPIVAVQKVVSDTEAFERMADSRYGLTASVWTADPKRVEWFAAGLRVGSVLMNRCDYVDPWLPWSGIGDSGAGQTLGAAGFDTVTRPQALHLRS